MHLLDTHTLIWALSDPGRLPRPVREVLEEPSSIVFVSVVSAWEIAIKSALGKIDFPLKTLPQAMDDSDFAELPVTMPHALAVRDLPPYHRDPFDRLLIAQAIYEKLTLISCDPLFHGYPVRVWWNS